jgi:DNA-binding NarL/FixJ family response regulator
MMMLTPRQSEIARMLAREMSYKAISRELGISVRTVEDHVHDAARRINPATSRPCVTLALWFVRIHDDPRSFTDTPAI